MVKHGFVLFDFDGVIADSFAQAMDTAKIYCKHKTDESYRKQYEGNVWDEDLSLKVGDHSECQHDLKWFETFVPMFEERGALFAGMDTVVRHLAQQHRMVIISSSVKSAIEGFLKRHDLADCFEEILDSDVHRSKTVKIGMVFDTYGIGPADCVMITDSRGDILEAREKGVDSIAVTWGYNRRAALEPGNPWRIIELPDEIPNAVTEFFKGKGTAA